MGGLVNKSLENGEQVVLANWDQYEPTQHGAELRDRAWNAANSRTGLAFYESTVQFMRNDWAEKNMSPQHIQGSTDNVALYYSNETNTWHTADALDVDHITPWKQHLQALDVANMAEAHMGYNDVANLRALPSFFNRARDSGEKVLEQHGIESPQWQKWVNDRIGYDHTVDHPAFDPQTDKARRTIATTGQPWTQDHTRSDLSFDTRVNGKWFEHQLQESFVGTAKLPCAPMGSTQDVPLFRCSVTGQLVTRDALDIDHRVPFETVLKDLQEKNPNGLSKAQVLDAYNDTGNLRLVGRSANSSHEWELDRNGQFRDKEIPERPNEFKGWLVQDKGIDPQVRRMLDEHIDRVPKPFPPRDPSEEVRVLIPRRKGDGGGSDSMEIAPTRAPLLNEQGHPDNGVFRKVMEGIDRIDPKGQLLPDTASRENMASSLMVAAKMRGLPGIDQVVPSTDFKSMFAVTGSVEQNTHQAAGVQLDIGKTRTVEQNTLALAQLSTPQQSQLQPQSGQDLGKPHSQHF
jgi:hypothetical protein